MVDYHGLGEICRRTPFRDFGFLLSRNLIDIGVLYTALSKIEIQYYTRSEAYHNSDNCNP